MTPSLDGALGDLNGLLAESARTKGDLGKLIADVQSGTSAIGRAAAVEKIDEIVRQREQLHAELAAFLRAGPRSRRRWRSYAIRSPPRSPTTGSWRQWIVARYDGNVAADSLWQAQLEASRAASEAKRAFRGRVRTTGSGRAVSRPRSPTTRAAADELRRARRSPRTRRRSRRSRSPRAARAPAPRAGRRGAGACSRPQARGLPPSRIRPRARSRTRRPEQQREVAVLRERRAPAARHSTSPVQPAMTPSAPITAASRCAASRRPPGRGISLPGERTAVGFANAKLPPRRRPGSTAARAPARAASPHRADRRRARAPCAAREEGLERLGGELDDVSPSIRPGQPRSSVESAG